MCVEQSPSFSCIEIYFAVKLRYVNIELHINVPAKSAFLTEAETLFLSLTLFEINTLTTPDIIKGACNDCFPN